jgi:hypothetical protein
MADEQIHNSIEKLVEEDRRSTSVQATRTG